MPMSLSFLIIKTCLLHCRYVVKAGVCSEYYSPLEPKEYGIKFVSIEFLSV